MELISTVATPAREGEGAPPVQVEASAARELEELLRELEVDELTIDCICGVY